MEGAQPQSSSTSMPLPTAIPNLTLAHGLLQARLRHPTVAPLTEPIATQVCHKPYYDRNYRIQNLLDCSRAAPCIVASAAASLDQTGDNSVQGWSRPCATSGKSAHSGSESTRWESCQRLAPPLLYTGCTLEALGLVSICPNPASRTLSVSHNTCSLSRHSNKGGGPTVPHSCAGQGHNIPAPSCARDIRECSTSVGRDYCTRTV